MKKLQPPEKSHPTLSQQPPSQNWDPVKPPPPPPPLEKWGGGPNPPPPPPPHPWAALKKPILNTVNIVRKQTICVEQQLNKNCLFHCFIFVGNHVNDFLFSQWSYLLNFSVVYNLLYFKRSNTFFVLSIVFVTTIFCICHKRLSKFIMII